MEDVLDVYQLLDHSREPIPMQPAGSEQAGHPLREDYEYVREGMCSFFMVFAPLLFWRHVAVTQRRTAQDFAHVVRELVDVYFPDADKIVLVLDNLNTHSVASLYEAFAPAEAKRIADRLEIHYTPKHGSWLNQAEIELSVLGRQCLDRRLPDVDTLKSEVLAWEQARNTAGVTVNWHFTTADARIKLVKLYPCILP
jgi:hypothetical protein